MKKFTYQYSKTFTEKEYVEIEGFSFDWNLRAAIKLIVLLAICVLLLFSIYTLAFGILGLLILISIYFITPFLFNKSAKKKFYGSGYIRKELTYGVDHNGFWVEGQNINETHKWNELKFWTKDLGYLILRVYPKASLYFQIKDLQQLGIYKRIVFLCKKNSLLKMKKKNKKDQAKT